MPMQELRQRYRIKLLNQDENQILLEFIPMDKRDQSRFDRAFLILKPGEYTPAALKLADSTGAESVHVFTDVLITREGGPRGNPFVGLERLDRPNLQGYRKVVSPDVSPRGAEQGRPRSIRTTPR
jgi:hypothetical protein